MKNRIRELTDRRNGWGNEYRALKLTQYIRGWVNYFGMADVKSMLQSNDEWLRQGVEKWGGMIRFICMFKWRGKTVALQKNSSGFYVRGGNKTRESTDG